MSLNLLRMAIREKASAKRAKASEWFFKTGEGQYGYGDTFLGLSVPESRAIAKKFHELALSDIERLLASKYHEERLIALLILIYQYAKGDPKSQNEIYNFYLSHTKYINNWDLVDTSAGHIIGDYLFQKSQIQSSKTQVTDMLKKLARSENLWERRIAIIATSAFINKGVSRPTLQVAEILLHDKEDLIQKAVGWMLREVGKRVSQADEEAFLKKHYKTMPRTMLRYAIERFEPKKRMYYLGKSA